MSRWRYGQYGKRDQVPPEVVNRVLRRVPTRQEWLDAHPEACPVCLREHCEEHDR